MWTDIIAEVISGLLFVGLFMTLHYRIRRLELDNRELQHTVDSLDFAVGGPHIRVQGGPFAKMGYHEIPAYIRKAVHLHGELDFLCLPDVDKETGRIEPNNNQHYTRTEEDLFKYVGPCREVMGARHFEMPTGGN